MASPFQQQARLRKIWYIGVIIALFTLALLWRRADGNYFGVSVKGIDAQAEALSIREESRGEVDLTGSVVRLGLTGSRGLATCILWNVAIEAQKKNQWNQLDIVVRSLTKLQPYFITPWLFQSWNLSYNVSVESDRIRDKYFYVARGIELLAQGDRQNRDHPDLRWSVGFYLHSKLMMSDETNYMRSLYQLSSIPPQERDPRRFWKQGNEGPEFQYAEFKDFAEKHPHLIRRLREGIRRETERERKRQFDTRSPEAVVRFLEDNYSVPSLYRTRLLELPYDPQAKDELLPVADRFPVLPPPRDDKNNWNALTHEDTIRDEHDPPTVSYAWYCYAQEPLPRAGSLPGSSEPVSRARPRRPRNMTTLIFRAYPAQARRYSAERLQAEGWFDEEQYNVSDWFEDVPDRALAGETVLIGEKGRKWAEESWSIARDAWKKHGTDNHILFPNPTAEQNMRNQAEAFARRGRILTMKVNESDLDDLERAGYEAAKFLEEYDYYRQLTKFAHHYNRSIVEAKPETIACRKLFDRAERLAMTGQTLEALRIYRTPVAHPAWGGDRAVPPTPLEAWRDLVLMKNKEFRRDEFTEEYTADVQIRYQMLLNRQDGVDIKKKVVDAAGLLPLVPKTTQDAFRPPILLGPFDTTDDEGVKFVSDYVMDRMMDRMHLPTRRIPPQTDAALTEGEEKMRPKELEPKQDADKK